jgi:hypothetical protein
MKKYNKEKSSEAIPKGSREEISEKVALFKFYVLKDPRDGLIKYVGRTVEEKNRFRNHIYEAKKNNRNKKERWIISLLRKNLLPELEVVYQEKCSIEEAAKIEKMLVKKLSKRFQLKNDNDNYAGVVLNGTPVFQYDLEGNKINSFANSNQAMISTGVKDVNITRCCKNENGYGSKTAGGFFWSFIDYKKYPHEYVSNWRKLKGKPVLQYDLKGNFIAEYSTARIAEKETGTSYKKISAVCNGRQNKTNGFIWKFKQ